ncbi:MAG: hypothetical protein RSG59_08035 [Ruthenibacterium sp.]
MHSANKNAPEGAWLAPVPTPGQACPAGAARRIKNPAVCAIVNQPASHTDPNGSYTGHPVEKGETPQQDADDL